MTAGVCHSVCFQNNSNSNKCFLMPFSGNVDSGVWNILFKSGDILGPGETLTSDLPKTKGHGALVIKQLLPTVLLLPVCVPLPVLF